MSKGAKSSEFWLTLAATLLSFLFASGVIPTGSWIEMALGIGATILGALGYQVSRTIVKAKGK